MTYSPPLVRADALNLAASQSVQQHATAEGAARLRVEFMDQWDSRWSMPIPGGKNYT